MALLPDDMVDEEFIRKILECDTVLPKSMFLEMVKDHGTNTRGQGKNMDEKKDTYRVP